MTDKAKERFFYYDFKGRYMCYDDEVSFFSDRVAEKVCKKFGIQLSDCVEYVLCADGVLRPIDAVDANDRFVWPDRDEDDIDYYLD